MAVSATFGSGVVDFQPMSPEEMQRMMQFLLQQQAQFASDLAKLSEETDRRTNRITDALFGLTGIVGQLAAAQLRTDEQLKELRGQLGETDAYIRTVESHLNALIDMFERHLREDHGHGPS
jgi:hypothetical protein